MIDGPKEAEAHFAALDEQGDGRGMCGGCRREIDPETCGCGSEKRHHGVWDGHPFVPMGCDCYRDKGDQRMASVCTETFFGSLEQQIDDGMKQALKDSLTVDYDDFDDE